MHYPFPKIETINDVLPSIEGRDEFVVANREHYTVINYLVSMDDTFPEIANPSEMTETDRHYAIRRECRGLIFDTDGKIISRRLHKFHNVGEREETQINKIDLSKPHVILEKLDGSMVTPISIGGNIRWGTKMGITEVALGAEEFVAKNPQYQELARWCILNDKTPIFEWVSRKQRIVIDYAEDDLILLAIRDNVTGEYMPYS